MTPYNQQSALDTLIYKLFDYAGMFPPAQRSFEQAIKESSALATTLERPWMVGSDLVLDIEHIRQLSLLDHTHNRFNRTVSVCALATEDYVHTHAALEALTSKTTGAVSARVVAIEVKVSPGNASDTIANYAPLARQLGALLACEPDLSTPTWRDTLRAVVDVARAAPVPVALKCRCSGPTGIGPDRLAAAILTASNARLPFKVTGGLHHPIVELERHASPVGFLNVAAAIMLARVFGNRASESLLAEVVQNRSFSALKFSTGISFGSLSISHEQLVQAKVAAHFSIGSCSLHEPDEDLVRLLAT